MPLSEVEGFKLRLNDALHRTGMSKAELARKIEEQPQLLNKWFNTEINRIPGAAYVAKLADALNVNLVWLVTGKGDMSQTPRQKGLTEVVSIPFCDVQFTETNGTVYHENHLRAPATFGQDFFLRRGLNPADCKLIRTQDNGMAPLIQEGDLALICDRLESLESGAIYAISYNNQVMLRRLIKQFNTLIVIAENKDYPEAKFEDEPGVKVRVIGKVIARFGTV